MGKLKAFVPLFFAILVSLVATGVIYRWIQSKTPVPVPDIVKEDTVKVALAVSDIPWGTKLTKDMVSMVPFPKQALPSGHFSDAVSLDGRVLVAPVKKNEPILECRLAPTSITTGGVGAVVGPGKRAIAVAGDKVIGMAGLIQPGSRVDVLGTLKSPQNDKECMTKVVLENVLVLATGTQIQNNEDGKPAPVDVFTLELNLEEAEKVSLASTQGKLHFALRNFTDKEVVYTMGATVPDILDGYRPRLELVKQPVIKSAEVRELPRRAAFEVQTIKGVKVTKQTF